MRFRRGTILGNVVTTAWVALALGCSDVSAPPGPSTDEGSPSPISEASPAADFNPDILLLGQAISRALQQDEIGPWLRGAISESPLVEWRIDLKSLLLNQNAGPAIEKIRTRVQLSSGRLTSLPPLELYLPIESHRASWDGAGNIDVAVRSLDGDHYLLMSPDGSAREIPEDYDPGARITLVLARSEIDYTDPSSAIRDGPATGSGMLARAAASGQGQAGLPPIMRTECIPTEENNWCSGWGGGGGGGGGGGPVGGDTSLRTRFNYLMLVHDHEGLLSGLNEIEIFGEINGAYASCGWATSIHYGTYYGVQWFDDAPHSTLATAVPVDSYRFKLVAYEDDNERCVVHPSDDELGSWPTGLTLSQYSYYFYTENPSELQIQVRPLQP